MHRDIRETPLYKEAEGLFQALRAPGTGQIGDAVEVHASPDGRQATFTGTITDRLEGAPQTRIGLTDLTTGDTRVVTFGPNIDRLPKFSPDGSTIAFLSDRHQANDFQLYLLNPATGAARAAPRVEGWVEYLHWSPDGKRILLGVAGHGADVAGGQGAVSSKESSRDLASWMPSVQTGDESHGWRGSWLYDAAKSEVCRISKPDINVWEANWCGNGALAAVVSPGPGEGLWYTARLTLINVATGDAREILAPKDQLGWPAGSPSGRHLAIVEALCSDRWFVAGDLLLIDPLSGESRQIDTNSVDITYTEWRADDTLLLAGHRGFETVVGVLDAHSGNFKEVWSSHELTAVGGFYAAASGIGDRGECVVAGRGFIRPPELAHIRGGDYRTVRSFDLGYGQETKHVGSVEQVTWKSNDGFIIQGWLLQPKTGKTPHPLVMIVHGGPVGHTRPMTLPPLALLLLKRGYAIFYPNPRGSSGRGQPFVRSVCGDMGGADAQDLLSGLDELVKRGVADPKRLGVTGVSYGGFMTSWLITQDNRFAAAVSISPVTNQVTEHLLSNISEFVRLFLNDSYANPGGQYFQRSPIMHAHKAKTPTLNIAGALDRCTPPEEAVQFHNALRENGVKSALVIYPEEGHGVRKLPASIDFTARLVGWFEEHMVGRID